MGGGSFLGGWLAGDLATRKDHSVENKQLRTEVNSTTDIALASMSSVRSWKATAHNLQARLKARRETEDELLEQLTTADVRVPLGNPDAFQKQYTENYVKSFTDPEVIEKTFENGQIPDGPMQDFEDWKKEEGIE